ncbi:MAG: AcrR family transcriptional regulator, partial [Halieaceae bacterium]
MASSAYGYQLIIMTHIMSLYVQWLRPYDMIGSVTWRNSLGSIVSKIEKEVESTGNAPVLDGRRLRTRRSREAIIEAGQALIAEGILVPTAQLISERAGVGIRSFFRHFPDMESLFATVEKQGRESVEALFIGGDRDGTLSERILHAVERRADGYEDQRNAILSTAAQRWRYEILRKNYARYQRGLRKDLEGWLPELKAMSGPEREAVDAVASAEMWLRLREHQSL